ncbi:MAG TPA: Zn-dependent protease [Bacteroidales bacterium]|nr:Zn-dependent protease [Bacteroidales bacterium]
METKGSRLLLIILLSIYGDNLNAQVYSSNEPFAHTFSIVAKDTLTGEMAVGVQSHWFSVGSIVSWAKSGVGVIATQSFVNPAFGPDGLKLMAEGKTAKEALSILIEGDKGRDFRQLAILDANGTVFSYTGSKCVASANHIIGENYSVQANMMLNDNVVPAMAKAFEENSNLPLPERVVKVMQEAQLAGGDIRGKQSAVLLVVSDKPVEHEWMDKKIDLRVDDHSDPLPELERLLKVHRAYEHMNNGDLAIEHNDMDLALKEYGIAESMFPDNLEMKFWKAVALANNGLLEDAMPIFKYVFKIDKNWIELTKRLPKSGLLNVSDEDLSRIINL